jgi:ketosteroid isomerase-like protein
VSEDPTTPEFLEEATRRSIEAFSRRDWDAALDYFAPDGIWDMSPQGVGVFQGHDAIRGLFEDWWAAFEYFEQMLEEFRNFGGGVMLAVIFQRARLTGSDGFIDLRYAAVVTWAEGLIERLTSYPDIGEARAAAELLAEERGQAMSEESTPDVKEIALLGFEAMSRRDLDALMRGFAPNCEFDLNAWSIGTFEGRAAARGFIEDWLGSYDEYRAEPEEVVDFGHGVVFVCYHEHARLAGSGAALNRRQANVWSRRSDGLIERIAWYTDIDEARAAAERLAEERG